MITELAYSDNSLEVTMEELPHFQHNYVLEIFHVFAKGDYTVITLNGRHQALMVVYNHKQQFLSS